MLRRKTTSQLVLVLNAVLSLAECSGVTQLFPKVSVMSLWIPSMASFIFKNASRNLNPQTFSVADMLF